MTDVEFVEPDDELDPQRPHDPQESRDSQDPDGDPEPSTDQESLEGEPDAGAVAPFDWQSPVTGVLLIVAAVLAVQACFRNVFSVFYGTQANRQGTSVDGWGRIVDITNVTPAAEHGTRYGIVLCTAAGLLLIAAVTGVLQHTKTLARSLALLSAGLLAGSLAGALLEAKSNFDNLRVELRLEALDSADPTPSGNVSTTYGWCIWLGVIALALTVVAVALPFAVEQLQRRQADQSAPPEPLPPPPAIHPEDEVLGGPVR